MLEKERSATNVLHIMDEREKRRVQGVESRLEEEEADGIVAEEGKASTAAQTSTFKSSLQRFRHPGAEDTTPTPDLPPDSSSQRKSSRKRANDYLNDVDATDSTSPAKKRRQSSKYAPPSKYAHLPKLVDILEPNLICAFIGFNPGVRTATAGHAYAHPSNLFWKLLHSSGCTDVRLKPEQDVDLPRLYSMGNTNIVDRPSKDAAELSKKEMAAGTPVLEEKIRVFRPEAICIVGKGIWEAIWRWKYKREIKKDEFRYGWQDEKERTGVCEDWEGAWVFVATATSGLSASLRPHEKEAIWKPFGEWVKKRREERRMQAAVSDEG